ncbi:DUF4864 domain-containing protein [Nitrospira defluvii]|nr:DUF4864 domain-containing protein [Nitrospira defluvii]
MRTLPEDVRETPMNFDRVLPLKKGQTLPATALSLSIFLLFIFTHLPAYSFDSPKRQIKSAITQQLRAFKNNDYRAAYQFASSHIQSEFSLTQFETMVRTAYPQIDKSLKISFGKITLFSKNTRATAIVHITGMDRTTVTARYRMVLEEGGWKNNGVIHLRQLMPI